jgi:hypothetical protein
MPAMPLLLILLAHSKCTIAAGTPAGTPAARHTGTPAARLLSMLNKRIHRHTPAWCRGDVVTGYSIHRHGVEVAGRGRNGDFQRPGCQYTQLPVCYVYRLPYTPHYHIT